MLICFRKKNETADRIIFATPQLVFNLSNNQLATPCTLIGIEDYPKQQAISVSQEYYYVSKL